MAASQLGGHGAAVGLRLLLSAMSGCLITLSLPKPDIHQFAWICLVPLLIAIQQSYRWKEAAVHGYIAGVLFFAGTCYWFIDTMTIYGGLAWSLAAAIYVLFCLIFALHFAVFAAMLRYSLRAFSIAGLLLAVPLWVLVEFVRAHGLFSGFPWMLIGYGVAPYEAIVQVAAWTGIYGLSAIVVLANVLLTVAFLTSNRWIALPVGAAIIGAGYLPGPADGPRGEALPVRIVQSNIDIDFPWGGKEGESLLRELTALSMKPSPTRPRLIVWPEVPAPFYLNDDPAFRSVIERIAQRSRSFVLLGYVDRIGESASNSAGLVSPAGQVVSRYDKIQLVPFGEYVPLSEWVSGLVGKMTRQVGDFKPGSEYTLSPIDDHRLATVICYESIFPGLVRQFTRDGAELLVVITNDGWFGKTSAPYQHLRMGVVRAVENGRYIVRAANTGISAIIDPRGRVLSPTPIGTRTVLDGEVEFRRERTVYVEYGDWFAWVTIALGIGAFGIAFVRLRRNST